MKLSEVTPIQVLGGVLVVNTVLAGGSTQLTDLFGPAMANHILSVCILGSGICGGFIMQMGGLPSQARNVIAAGGAIDVSANAAPALATMAMDPTQQKIGPAPGASAAVAAIAKSAASALLLALVLSFLLAPASASAQTGIRKPQPKQTNGLPCDPANLLPGCKAAAAVADGMDPKAALPCMDVTVLTKLSLANLIPTMKACVQDVNNQLVTDTQRALDSAKNFTKTGETAAVGDSDGVNCLTPALALFRAASIVPAVPDVTNPDGTIKTTGTPELDPGPILLFQKYREFTIAGGLTSCQTWVNGPTNATAGAIGGAVGTVAGAALLK